MKLFSDSRFVFSQILKTTALYLFIPFHLAIIRCAGSHTDRQSSSDEILSELNSAAMASAEAGQAPRKSPLGLILYKVYFGLGKYDLTLLAKQTLAENAEALKAHPEVHVIIEGHSDNRGSAEQNFALAEKRAKAVKNYLIGLGVNPSQLTTMSYGADRPLDLRENEEAWARNRRVEFKIRSTTTAF